jgi:23S rRNA (cytosine1962-C5)-methyltransferase
MITLMLVNLLERALLARQAFFDTRHDAAFRLFNGFLEGYPDLVIDLYGQTAIIHDYSMADSTEASEIAANWLQAQLAWVDAILLKRRNGPTDAERNGRLIFGGKLARKVREHGVWYAVDLAMNRDASLYLDTRNLRHWLLNEMAGKSVFNTFAYTGSLGVAAMAAGAQRVVQTDLNKRFLNVGKTSYSLNGFPIVKRDFVAGDFWSVVKQFNRAKQLFDCVILDPPFFAESAGGRIDLERDMVRLVNKLRPLVKNNGQIIAVNNALFLSGADYMAALEALTVGGYVEIEGKIDVAEDFVPASAEFVTNPTPFNHSTKIAVLRIHHRS